MTRKYDSEIGAKNFDANNKPAAKTYPAVESTTNKHEERNKYYEFHEIDTTSANSVFRLSAPDSGKIVAVSFANGATALDGTNGLKIVFINKTNADDIVASVGFGTGTNAAAAADAGVAVAANANADKKVTDTSTCNKGDVLVGTITRDGTAVTGVIKVEYQASAVGR